MAEQWTSSNQLAILAPRNRSYRKLIISSMLKNTLYNFERHEGSSSPSYTWIIHFSNNCCNDTESFCFPCPSDATVVHMIRGGTSPAGYRDLINEARLAWLRDSDLVAISNVAVRVRVESPYW